MKLNIFRIDLDSVDALIAKLEEQHLEEIFSGGQGNWHEAFYYSTQHRGGVPPWTKPYGRLLEAAGAKAYSTSPYAAHLFINDTSCFVVSYGRSHFYIRPWCDYDFGTEFAKRIADENDTRQTSGKRFAGTRRKDIKSFANNTALNIEPGESVEFLQAGVIEPHRGSFGKHAKFGTSVLLTVDVTIESIGELLTKIEAVQATPARFELPRTMLIKDDLEVARLDELLLDELTSSRGLSNFTIETYDLYGVDFVFSHDGEYTLKCPNHPAMPVEHLDIGALKTYIDDNGIPREQILNIKILLTSDGLTTRTPLKEAIDFIPDEEGSRTILCQGRWTRFNQDYLDALDSSLRTIEVEPCEPEFAVVARDEGAFNSSAEVSAAGYTVADKDFSVLRTKAPTPVEAWDLQRGTRVYAVKIGTPQRLGYVCDQATATLELLRNRANVRKVPSFSSYCLWLGYRARRPMGDITLSNSIILKMKIEAWARKAQELGVTPVLKISHTPD